MNKFWAIGFGVGLLIAAIALFLRQKFGKACKYDERQVAVRGKAFKAGFITFVICELCVFLTESLTDAPFVVVAPGFVSIIIMLLGFLVMLEIAIFEDAYFSPERPFSMKWCILMLLLAILTTARGFMVDDLWGKYINFSFGIFMLIVLFSIIIKNMIYKKACDKDSEEEK